jgi:pyruvate carboxylase subunit B
MEKKKVKFSLVYRDMWQASGKYVPKKNQLEEVAPHIINMGCFDRVETNGGASEQVNLLYGENPNKSVRAFTKFFNDANIQTHMLDRGLNGLRMNPVPADVRKLMYKVKKAQGVDITRIFCGLNDVQNIIPSIRYAKEAGMIAQATLCITHSEIHTAEYYMNMADELIKNGADEICLKDMAGIGRPTVLAKIVKHIKTNYPHIITQYHGHSGPGFSIASMLEVAYAGIDYIDVAMEPLSWGMVHPDVITVREMLHSAGFDVTEINMNSYMEVRRLTQKFIDEFLGYFIDDRNKYMSSLLVGSGLPGGMMGSLMSDLKGIHQSINMYLKDNSKKELSEDDLLIKMFDEVKTIWSMLGNPPLVTPYSQYVKNIALMNVMSMIKGGKRWTMIDKNSWDMILGKAGKLPGKLHPDIIELAKQNNYEFFDGNPQDNYPDELDKFIKEMEEKGWDRGQDDEELFELAMHDRQYRDLKSGVAKERFNKELEQAIKDKFKSTEIEIPDIRLLKYPNAEPIIAPTTGVVMWEICPLSITDHASEPYHGKEFKEKEIICYIQTIYGVVDIKSFCTGIIVGVEIKNGTQVRKGEILGYIQQK